MTKTAVIEKAQVAFKPDRQARGSAHMSSYMKRLHLRREREALKNNIIFGLTFGWVLTLMGAFKTFILLEGGVSQLLLVAGLAFLATTLVAPGLMIYPHRVMKGIATFVGTNLFKAILTVVYFLTILPAGLVYQKKNNHEPFYSWSLGKPARIEGWTDKVASDENGKATEYSLPGWLQPLSVVIYFARNSQLLFLPCLVVLLMLGLIGVFVQSSALAPFIYTLF
ncbi:MAG TPA: hypothetical protein EYM95_19895 [Candidatus Obscuribacterales bacterium]|nr:hypothetical protein [Candidatus Obscuribacterales bacterium]